jgi:type I restriction enzyme M protein
MTADGWSLDDKRQPLLDADKLGTHPSTKLTAEEHEKNNLPDVLKRWHKREGTERDRARTEQSFVVKREEIVAADYDLSLNRYKEVVHEHVEQVAPLQLIAELNAIETDIQAGLKQLEDLLK